MLRQQRQAFAKRAGARKDAIRSRVRHACNSRRRLRKPALESVIQRRTKRERSIANGAVAGAAAQVSAQRMYVAWFGSAGTILFREEAHHKARSAVTALRSARTCHGSLRFVQLAARSQRFNSVNFLAGNGRQQQQATVHGAVRGSGPMLLHHNHGASAAFTLGAAFFGTRKPAGAQVFEQRCLHRGAAHFDLLAVQLKRKRRAGGRFEPH